MKIAIIHFRLGKTDGVSLEIDKRIKILRKLGHKLHFICGECSEEFAAKNKKNLSIIPELHLVKERAAFLLDTAINAKQMNLPEDVLIHWFAEREYKIYRKFDEIFSKHKIDRVIVHNVFSYPIVFPASSALIDVLDKYEIETLAVNHDFYFERGRYLETPYKYVAEQIKRMPPKRHYIAHNVINSIAQKKISEMRGISAEVIGDTWDFDEPPQGKDAFNKDFRREFQIEPNDVILLQATRILPNKCIENAVLFCCQLERLLLDNTPIKILGRDFNKNSRVVLFLSNNADIKTPSAKNYLDKVLKLADKLGIKVVDGFSRIASNRRENGSRKVYSFWDAYLHADLVTYPSIQEGFGNQLLEAFFYKKLPILFEYPVFKSDIKPGGYEYISLGDSLSTNGSLRFVSKTRIEKAVKKTIGIITRPASYKKMVDHNFKVAKKHHGIDKLEDNLSNWLKKS